jgi:hypothetical protein
MGETKEVRIGSKVMIINKKLDDGELFGYETTVVKIDNHRIWPVEVTNGVTGDHDIPLDYDEFVVLEY